MSTTHRKRLARMLAERLGITYVQAAKRVAAAAEDGRLPQRLDASGMDRALARLVTEEREPAAAAVEIQQALAFATAFDAASDTGFDADHDAPLVPRRDTSPPTTVFFDPAAITGSLSPHLVVTGSAGSGKSVVVRTLLAGAAASGWDLYVIGAPWSPYETGFIRPYARAAVYEPDEALAVLEAVATEIDRRYATLEAHSARSRDELPASERFRRALVVVDGVVDWMAVTSLPHAESPENPVHASPEAVARRIALEAEERRRSRVTSLLARIARMGRGAHVSLVVSAQRASAPSPEMRSNMSRLSMGPMTEAERLVALRDPDRAPRITRQHSRGTGVFEPVEGSTQAVAAWFETEGSLAEMLAELREPLTDGERLNLDGE